jgi:hypothetical protein
MKTSPAAPGLCGQNPGTGDLPACERKKMKRDYRIETWVSEAERASIISAAEANGLSLAAYARMTMLLTEPSDPKARRNVVDRAAVAAINIVGSNINQIARTANESKTMSPDQIRALAVMYKKLQHIVQQIDAASRPVTQ